MVGFGAFRKYFGSGQQLKRLPTINPIAQPTTIPHTKPNRKMKVFRSSALLS